MNHVLNVFYIYSLNFLRFGGTVLRKMMEFHHSLDFSWYHSPRALFTSSKGWQKADRTDPSSSSKTWFSCRGLQLYFGQGWTRAGCSLSILCLLLGFFGLGLLTWAGSFRLGCVHPTKWTSTTHVAMSFHSSWTFISKYFWVVYYDEFHTVKDRKSVV